MSEKETEVRSVRVALECNCGGNMKFTGTELTSYPPQYPHKCEKCGKTKNVRGKTYPYTKYVDL